MSGWKRLMAGRTQIDFVGRRKRWYTISGVAIAVSVLALALFGLNLGLEFRGGVAVQTENPAGADVAAITDALAEIGQQNAVIQLVNDGEAVRIETPPLDQDGQDDLRRVVAEVTGSQREDLSVEAVEPRFGALLARQAVIALTVFLGAVALFITWRLEWKMALAGLAALAHDIIITTGVYAITRFEVTSATVVALLTILGYSLYDTVVVFDKVTEAAELADKSETYPDVVNRSMNQVLVRSLNTSLTSLLPVGSLLFVGSLLLGAASLQDFALALFVGIATGTYSSIFVAAPLLAEWKKDAEVGRRKPREDRAKTEGYTPRLQTAGPRRPPSGGSQRNRPPRPPRSGR
ncbi:MAG: protein translocase subunit SecF [Acidimicrobiia bacterium]|nr:protein translocase subunit SecF [Acidimicrobiia bacterium]MDH4306348.1 protein translocase subunit SecF [Acidimicrobiia bacterium]MDH5292249.1 protein translocase subunit SecF [Acidimicrobiia bacterium]